MLVNLATVRDLIARMKPETPEDAQAAQDAQTFLDCIIAMSGPPDKLNNRHGYEGATWRASN